MVSGAPIKISLLVHRDHVDHGLANVKIALLPAISWIVPPERDNAHVFA
jgi:hypothetical protein